jgi:hypothetical protein
MNEQLQEDWLDAKLRDDMPYIDDDGFTSRVSQQLPVRRRKTSPARSAVLLVVSLMAVVVAFAVAGGTGFLLDVVGWFAVMPSSLLFAVVIGCGLLVTALGLYAAINRSRKLRS